MIAFVLPVVGSLKHSKSQGLFDEVYVAERKEIDMIVGDSHVSDLLTRSQGTVTQSALPAGKDRSAFGRLIREYSSSQILSSAGRLPAKTQLGHFSPTCIFPLTDCIGKQFNSFCDDLVGTIQPTPPNSISKMVA
jgi:hypothetical protein